MSLSDAHLCESSLTMGSKIIAINSKENKNPKKCTNKKKLNYFKICRSNSRNKAKKQIFEAKTVMETKL